MLMQPRRRCGSVSTAPLPDIEMEEFITAVSSLSVGKAAGPDAVLVRLIKNNIYVLVIRLLHIFNDSLANGVHPGERKVAKVVSIFKDSELSDLRNYWPISMLNSINTAFQKLLCQHMQNF